MNYLPRMLTRSWEVVFMCESEEEEALRRGTGLASVGRFRQSVEWLERVLSRHPADPAALVAKASSL